MALTDENRMVMPVQPMYGNGGGGGFGFGGDWAWILLLLVLGGGWGGFGGFGMGGMMGAGMLGMDMGFGLYPWLNNSQNINDGFTSSLWRMMACNSSIALCLRLFSSVRKSIVLTSGVSGFTSRTSASGNNVY